jgi:hypothetical protein
MYIAPLMHIGKFRANSDLKDWLLFNQNKHQASSPDVLGSLMLKGTGKLSANANNELKDWLRFTQAGHDNERTFTLSTRRTTLPLSWISLSINQ